MVEITRDGFTLLVMGYTGKKAMQFKLAYIDAFNKMEAELIKRSQPTSQPKQVAYTPLLPSQQRDIQEAIAKRVYETYTDRAQRDLAFKKIYGAIKTQFRVGTYTDLTTDQFNDAMEYIMTVDIGVKQDNSDNLHYVRFVYAFHSEIQNHIRKAEKLERDARYEREYACDKLSKMMSSFGSIFPAEYNRVQSETIKQLFK